MNHKVERVGISVDKTLLDRFDRLIKRQGYANRSEAVRDLIRDRLNEDRLEKPDIAAVAGIFLVYDHHTTGLTQKLNALQHSHLLRVIASTHVHIDHHNCLEVIMLRGKARDIRRLADNITSLKGVKLSRVNIMTAQE